VATKNDMTKPKRILIGDAWFWATENKSTCIFIRYTWRGHVRQWKRLYQVIKHGSEMKTKPRLVLRGDSTWFIETKDKSTLIFVAHTWRHHVRLLIGIDGYMGDGEYVFRRGRVRFRGAHALFPESLAERQAPSFES